MSTLGRLCQLKVTATSPNKRVRATATVLNGVRVAIAGDAARDDGDSSLAKQVSAAVSGALRGIRRGEEEVLRDALAELDEGCAMHASLTRLLRFRAEQPKVAVAASSEAGNVRTRMDGYDRVAVGIKRGCEQRLSGADLEREIDQAVAAAVRDFGRRLKEATGDDR